MRLLLLSVAASVVLLSLASPADARRSGSTSQELLFVAPTSITGPDGKALSLCHLVETRGFLFINLFRSSESYALATNSCLTDAYVPVTTEMLTTAKAAGDISDDIPDQPGMTTAQMVEGHWGLAAVAALILFAVAAGLKRKGRTRDRQAAIGGGSDFATRILDVMCHAAKSDGQIDTSEIDLISTVSRKLTGTAFSREKISQIMDLAEAKPNEADFRNFGKGLAPQQHLKLIEGALLVIAADGKLEGKEKEFVAKLAKGLKIPPDAVQKIFANMMHGPQPRTS